MSNPMTDLNIKTINTMKQSENKLESNEKEPIIKKAETLHNPKLLVIKDIIDKWSQYRYHGAIKRRAFSLSFIYNDYLYVLGGTDISEGKLSDINRLKLSESELNKWELIKPSLAFEKTAYAAGVLCEGDYYIIGGQNQSLASLKRIMKYIVQENTLEYILIENNAIPAIDSHSACLLEKKIYLFGGNSNDKRLNDVFIYDIENCSSLNLTESLDEKPLPRNEHSGVIVDNSMYVYGGMGDNENYLNDLWKYSISENKWTQMDLNEENSPVGRIGHSLIAIEAKIFLFGGMTKIIRETNELWMLDTISEANGFIKIHDNIVEVEDAIPDECCDEFGQSPRKQKKKFRLLSHSEVEKRTNPNFYSQYVRRKPNPLTKKPQNNNLGPLIVNTEQSEKSSIMNFELKRKANVANMKNSNIFSINKAEANLINEKLKDVTKANIPQNMLYFKGFPPTPRNGQSALVFGTKLLIFGGDRNKMAFNDMYCFDTNLND